MVVNMLQNLSHIYSSYNNIIKCVDFKPIYYDTNSDVVSSSIFFRIFNFVFLSMNY